MGIFTNPVTINDGTDDHIFAYRRQLADSNIIGSDYVESAADPASKSTLTVKHDVRSSVPRHLLQRSVYKIPAADPDGVLRRITVNITITAHELFSEAEIQPEVTLTRAGAGVANFVKSNMSCLI
jgi:hypothetical protein